MNLRDSEARCGGGVKEPSKGAYVLLSGTQEPVRLIRTPLTTVLLSYSWYGMMQLVCHARRHTPGGAWHPLFAEIEYESDEPHRHQLQGHAGSWCEGVV